MDWNIHESYRLRRTEMLARAEHERQAHVLLGARKRHVTRAWRRRVGGLLIAAGQALMGSSLCTAYDEARVIVDRSCL